MRIFHLVRGSAATLRDLAEKTLLELEHPRAKLQRAVSCREGRRTVKIVIFPISKAINEVCLIEIHVSISNTGPGPGEELRFAYIFLCDAE